MSDERRKIGDVEIRKVCDGFDDGLGTEWFFRWDGKEHCPAIPESLIRALWEAASPLRVDGDEHHTLDELYRHRASLFAALVRCHPEIAWRSKSDAEGKGEDGWFLAGMHLPTGDVSYHYPIDLWSLFDVAKTLDKAPPFDGHTAPDVVERLDSWQPLQVDGEGDARISTAIVGALDEWRSSVQTDDTFDLPLKLSDILSDDEMSDLADKVYCSLRAQPPASDTEDLPEECKPMVRIQGAYRRALRVVEDMRWPMVEAVLRDLFPEERVELASDTEPDEIGPTSEFEGWRVEVLLWGVPVLGIEPESYGGASSAVLDQHRRALRVAAACLSRFVDSLGDMAQEEVEQAMVEMQKAVDALGPVEASDTEGSADEQCRVCKCDPDETNPLVPYDFFDGNFDSGFRCLDCDRAAHVADGYDEACDHVKGFDDVSPRAQEIRASIAAEARQPLVDAAEDALTVTASCAHERWYQRLWEVVRGEPWTGGPASEDSPIGLTQAEFDQCIADAAAEARRGVVEMIQKHFYEIADMQPDERPRVLHVLNALMHDISALAASPEEARNKPIETWIPQEITRHQRESLRRACADPYSDTKITWTETRPGTYVSNVPGVRGEASDTEVKCRICNGTGWTRTKHGPEPCTAKDCGTVAPEASDTEGADTLTAGSDNRDVAQVDCSDTENDTEGSADYWKGEALRYAQNVTHWQNKCASIAAEARREVVEEIIDWYEMTERGKRTGFLCPVKIEKLRALAASPEEARNKETTT